MTSTSEDVCELWNGHNVVRVPSLPCILQVVYTGRENDRRKIYDLKGAVDLGLYKSKLEGGDLRTHLEFLEYHPNPAFR